MGPPVWAQTEKPMVRHLEDAPHVRWLLLVEQKIDFQTVCILAVPALPEPKNHECIKKIARTAWMQTQAAA